MDLSDLNTLLDLARANLLSLLAVASVALFVAGGLIDGFVTASRSRALFRALNDSARGVTAANRTPGRRGFDAEVHPPPEPFARFAAEHHTTIVLNPAVWLFPATLHRDERLLLMARLPAAPTQELAWARDRTPPAAVAPQPHPELWTLAHLDFVAAEYVTRGLNPNGVRHVFAELQRRFGPQLEQVVVARDEEWHVRIAIRTPALVMADVPILVSLMRALGRAAGL